MSSVKNNSDLLLEICVDCLESIRNAIEGGADRLELCSALSEGGLTPSLGLAKLAKRIATIPVFAMIRIRGGDFVYEPDELDAMLDDLHSLKSIGIDGFVFGALTSANQLDVASCRKIIEAAAPLPVTFHRAFDDLDDNDPFAILNQIRDLGFARILTSGRCRSAEEGADLIAQLVKRSANNGGIIVMPGAGVNQENIASVRDISMAREFHGSAKRLMEKCDDGKVKVGSSGGVTVTDVETVRAMVKILKGTS